MPCMEKNDCKREPQAIATSIDASEEQSMDHIAEEVSVGSFHYGVVHKPVSVFKKLWKDQKPNSSG